MTSEVVDKPKSKRGRPAKQHTPTVTEIKIKTHPYQTDFLLSTKRFPALISAIGTGKTYMLLLKVWKFCVDYPNALCLVCRKEYTDLRDSTLKDFERYFNGAKPDSNKEYRFKNGSLIMFRHAAEIDVLKNINLSLFAIEQAEEFEDDQTFTFLRDRLRNQNTPIRQGLIIANANGHNWVWRNWINNIAVDGSYASTKDCKPVSEEYDPQLARTFDNAENLPVDFTNDLRKMEKEQPNHYSQYVLNRFDVSSGDRVFTQDIFNKAFSMHGKLAKFSKNRGVAIDIAGEGIDENVFCAGSGGEVMDWYKRLTMIPQETSIKAIDMLNAIDGFFAIIDCDGMGIRDYQQLTAMSKLLNGISIHKFHGSSKSTKSETTLMSSGKEEKRRVYANLRTEASFVTRQRIEEGRAAINPNDAELIEDLTADEYIENERGEIELIDKKDIKERLGRSPGKGDAFKMLQWALEQNYEDLRNRQDWNVAPGMVAMGAGNHTGAVQTTLG